MISDFSTSTIIDKCASEVVLMHTTEKYFDYNMMILGCGIQKVHM